MTRVHPGKPLNVPRSSTEKTRGVRRVQDATVFTNASNTAYLWKASRLYGKGWAKEGRNTCALWRFHVAFSGEPAKS